MNPGSWDLDALAGAGAAVSDALSRARVAVADAPRRVEVLADATPAQRDAVVAHPGTVRVGDFARSLGWATLEGRDGSVTYVTRSGVRITRGALFLLAGVLGFLLVGRRR